MFDPGGTFVKRFGQLFRLAASLTRLSGKFEGFELHWQ